MKIVFLTSHAIQYQLPAFARFASEDSWDISVIFLSRKGIDSYYDDDFRCEIKWPAIHQNNFESFYADRGTIFRRAFSCLRCISRKRPDILIVFGWMKFEFLSSLIFARTLQTDTLVISDANIHNTGAGAFNRFSKGLLFRIPTLFGVVGRNNRAYYRSFGVRDHKLVPWPYAVNNSFFTRQYDAFIRGKDALRRSIGIGIDSQVLIYSGKLTENKNILPLLRVFLDNKIAGAHLLIVGDGPLGPVIGSMIDSNRHRNVTWAGFKNQDEIGPYYAVADAIALLSTRENWGLAVNEGMLFGLPALVASNAGCAADLVVEGKTGLIHRESIPLEDSVRAILDLSRTVDRSGIRKHISQYNYDRWVDTVKTIYNAKSDKCRD